MASDTILGAADGALQRQGSATFSTGAVPRSSRSRSPTKRPAAAVMEAYEELFRGQDGSDMGSQGSQGPCGLDFLLQACDILEPEGSQLAKT